MWSDYNKEKTVNNNSEIMIHNYASMKEFPRAKPKGTPEGKGLYLTVDPELSPNTDIISF